MKTIPGVGTYTAAADELQPSLQNLNSLGAKNSSRTVVHEDVMEPKPATYTPTVLPITKLVDIKAPLQGNPRISYS